MIYVKKHLGTVYITVTLQTFNKLYTLRLRIKNLYQYIFQTCLHNFFKKHEEFNNFIICIRHT